MIFTNYNKQKFNTDYKQKNNKLFLYPLKMLLMIEVYLIMRKLTKLCASF